MPLVVFSTGQAEPSFFCPYFIPFAMDRATTMFPGGMPEGEELKQHLLNIAEMALWQVITPEWDDRRKLNALHIRVESLLRILKSVQGPWIDVSLQLRKEREYYLLNRRIHKEKRPELRTCFAKCNKLIDTIMCENTVITRHINYHVWLERKITEVMAELN